MKFWVTILAFAGLAACASPYSASSMPDIPGVNITYSDFDRAQLSLSHELPWDCEYIRDAILLMSARAALKYEFDHFELTQDEDGSQAIFLERKTAFDKVMNIHFCRGTCPMMYSANALSHVVLPKFSKATWTSTKHPQTTSDTCKIH